jgi:hypothetical protein
VITECRSRNQKVDTVIITMTGSHCSSTTPTATASLISNLVAMAAVQSSPGPLVPPYMISSPVAGPSRPTVQQPIELDDEIPSPPSRTKRAPKAKSRSRSATPAGEKRYACQYEGCDKAYTKPSRLAEHELSHTGEVCPFPGSWMGYRC